MMRYIIREKKDWEQFVQFILKHFKNKKIFLLRGNLGAGKTTFVQAFCKELNCKEHVTSPTFSILHIYHDNEKNPIYHFDLYRIKNLNELKEIGFEDYLYSDNYCFIEWPDSAVDLLNADSFITEKSIRISIEHSSTSDAIFREAVIQE